MDKKLVVCDIDNTLIVKHTELTPRARTVIEKLREHDVYFGIASGRSMPEVKRMIKSWGFDNMELLIGMNGSVLWDGVDQKEYEYFVLKKEIIQEIIEFMSQFKTTNTLMYKGDEFLCTQMDMMAVLSSTMSKMTAVKVKSLAEFYQEDNPKIMFRVREEVMKEIEAYVRLHPNDHYRAFKTQSTLLEFSDSHVSKGFTLRKFCEFHDIAMEEVIAFGDTSNDNDLLLASGWGVCMENGSTDTKQIADEITEKPCDEDGWADYMEEHFLKPRGWL